MVEDTVDYKLNEVITPYTEEELGEMDKERILKEWRKTLSYYSLNPEDF
jgi:hypothetical protein